MSHKTDAKGDVFRGLEVVEMASGITAYQMGDFAENVAGGIDCYTIRQPLGVTAGICPFNFPAMIPLWMFPVATACGNTMVLNKILTQSINQSQVVISVFVS